MPIFLAVDRKSSLLQGEKSINNKSCGYCSMMDTANSVYSLQYHHLMVEGMWRIVKRSTFCFVAFVRRSLRVCQSI